MPRTSGSRWIAGLLGLALLPSAFAEPAPPAATSFRLPAMTGGTVVSKRIRSLRELKFSNVIAQQTDYSCGAAALATILRYAYDLPVGEQEVIEGLFVSADQAVVKRNGFSMLDMKRFVEAIGMRARGYQLTAEQLPLIKVPTIALLDYKGYRHFVVVQRTDGDTVYTADPALGNRRVARSDFLKGWNGVLLAVIGPNYNRSNPLLTPPQPLLSRQMINPFRPLPEAELMEFGFIKSDFF